MSVAKDNLYTQVWKQVLFSMCDGNVVPSNVHKRLTAASLVTETQQAIVDSSAGLSRVLVVLGTIVLRFYEWNQPHSVLTAILP